MNLGENRLSYTYCLYLFIIYVYIDPAFSSYLEATKNASESLTGHWLPSCPKRKNPPKKTLAEVLVFWTQFSPIQSGLHVMKNFQNLLDMLSSVVEKNSVSRRGKRLVFKRLGSLRCQVKMSQVLATSREPPHLVA